ncbi:LIC10260 family lipoprotein [Leptospira alstonii]|uniref:LIC10260 family lipoprotein n=1 Tax=Leptospira alstonii TaxID=28452 RepID=UPI000774D4F3|nr:hypothetical protein [Leptospira alstonii]
MKVFLFVVLMLMILMNCSRDAKRISYVSLDKPKDRILSEGNQSTEFGKFRFGIFYIPPVGVYPYLKEAETKSGSSVLRNVDVIMRPGFCLLPLMPVLCATKHSVIVEGNSAQPIRE